MAKKTAKKSPARKSSPKQKKKTAKKPVKVAKKPAKAAKKAIKPAKKAPRTAKSKPAPKAKAGNTSAAVSTVAAVGTPAPNFSLPSSAGRTISLADYAGKTVVLYFYPRADTPGCTVEACGFRDAIAGYGKMGVDVLGVSPDPIADVQKFADKFNLNFPLLADTDHRISEAYGVWVQKSMYGKTYMGTARTTFIIRNGVIARVFEKVQPDGHEREVLAALSA